MGLTNHWTLLIILLKANSFLFFPQFLLFWVNWHFDYFHHLISQINQPFVRHRTPSFSTQKTAKQFAKRSNIHFIVTFCTYIQLKCDTAARWRCRTLGLHCYRLGHCARFHCGQACLWLEWTTDHYPWVLRVLAFCYSRLRKYSKYGFLLILIVPEIVAKCLKCNYTKILLKRQYCLSMRHLETLNTANICMPTGRPQHYIQKFERHQDIVENMIMKVWVEKTWWERK